jgi:hypothetical protein
LLSSVPAYETGFTISHLQGAALSANGTNNAILWITSGMGSGNLNAFDATTLKKLYVSNVGTVAHWFNPLVANGKVYVGATNSLITFGLLPALAVNAGNNQTGAVGTALPVALQVKVADPYTGNPKPGVLVNLTDAGVGGKFTHTLVATDSNGLATTNYALPTRPLNVTITAASTGYLNTTFKETATAGPAAAVSTKSGYGQTAEVNTTLPAPVCASVKDIYKNPVPNVAVHFTDNGANGRFSSNSVLTTSAGVACVSYTTPWHSRIGEDFGFSCWGGCACKLQGNRRTVAKRVARS